MPDRLPSLGVDHRDQGSSISKSRWGVGVFVRGSRCQQLHEALDRWDVWAAGYLVGEGFSDDMFIDFRATVTGMGREWYERVLAQPDELANNPDVRADATGGGR
jgi:hypothetical protein